MIEYMSFLFFKEILFMVESSIIIRFFSNLSDHKSYHNRSPV
jgi:hypothetical protein